MLATRLEILQPRFNFLPCVDAIHEVIPRRRSGETSHQLDGFSLNSARLGDGGRHGSKTGIANRDGKRVFRLTFQAEPRPLGAVGSGVWLGSFFFSKQAQSNSP